MQICVGNTYEITMVTSCRAKYQSIGFVVIGRNEGLRLQNCLNAIKQISRKSPVVYVDSGSTDDSVPFARSLNYEVVELDLTIPFTAARARNAGYQKLTELHTDIDYVQFLDGDCELQKGWVESAYDALSVEQDVGIVSGRRIEKNKRATIYNTLMDIEWDTPVGEIKAVPGDMCVKAAVFDEVSGFTENIISAEDDDFCIRVRKCGYKVLRLDADMTFHDANITQLQQWFKRSQRGGHGYANINHLHGGHPEYYFRRQLISVLFWGGLYPLALMVFSFITPTVALLLLGIYALFITKTIVRKWFEGQSLIVAVSYGLLIYSGKIPELVGVLRYWKTYLTSGQYKLIEYK